jgi:hypothetical protein
VVTAKSFVGRVGRDGGLVDATPLAVTDDIRAEGVSFSASDDGRATLVYATADEGAAPTLPRVKVRAISRRGP